MDTARTIRRALLISLCAWLPTAAQSRSTRGHWVNVEPGKDPALWILSIDSANGVHRLIPAPQFEAKYRLVGKRIHSRAHNGSVDSTFEVHGDTLYAKGQPAMLRMDRRRGDLGTFRPLKPNGVMDMFMTLRSDSEVVLEVGTPDHAVLSKDTIRIATGGANLVLSARIKGDTLLLTDAAGRAHRFLRRPWGCVGQLSMDETAAECR